MRWMIAGCLLAILFLPRLSPADTTYPSVTVGKATRWTGDPISLDVKDLDLRDFFRFIADANHLNIIIDPAVRGTVTMKVHDVPWDQVFDIVCRMNGLGYEVDGNVMGIKER